MAINLNGKITDLSGNQNTNSAGVPKMLMHTNTSIEAVPGNPQGRVIHLKQYEGCFYGDHYISHKPTTPSKHANILVSDAMDYEISFWFYQNHENPSIELSATGMNQYGFPTKFRDVVTGVQRDYFLSYPNKACGTPGRWHFARFILYRHNISSVEKDFLGKQPLTSLGVGTNLVMQKATNFVNIKLVNNSADVKLYNFIVKPLRTTYSTGFIQGGNFIELWRKVNNKAVTPEEVTRLTQQKLLPYNIAQLNTNI